MQTIHEAAALQRTVLEARANGKRIGLVPTMGNLHAGHASLIDIARREADLVVVSVFVNPTQFGPNEDYEKYPRTLEADQKVCEAHGADIVFAPVPSEIYAKDASTFVEENSCSQGLCGRYRPTHFRGVCTVVNLLFNLAQPNVAVFGQKDAQQAAVLKRMVRDLHIPVQIIVAPIVREADGLALSSRNQYLSQREREAAPKIFATLKDLLLTPESSGYRAEATPRQSASTKWLSRSDTAKQANPSSLIYKGGGRGRDPLLSPDIPFSHSERGRAVGNRADAETLRKELDAKLRESEMLQPQYVEIVDSETMQPLERVVPGHTLVAVAVYTAETHTRLIDNVVI